jgi:hypothetical protein
MMHIADIIERCRNKQVLVLLGGDESPEFKRQSQEFNQVSLDNPIQGRKAVSCEGRCGLLVVSDS